MSTSTFSQELLNILTQRYGQVLGSGELRELGIRIGHCKDSYPVSDVVTHLMSLNRLSNTLLMRLFSQVEGLPASYTEAFMRSFPVYRTETSCMNGHSVLRSTRSRRCLYCIENDLENKRRLKAIAVIRVSIKDPEALSIQEKVSLLDAYLSNPLWAKEFFDRSEKSGLINFK